MYVPPKKMLEGLDDIHNKRLEIIWFQGFIFKLFLSSFQWFHGFAC